jgi:hypothetical protein
LIRPLPNSRIKYLRIVWYLILHALNAGYLLSQPQSGKYRATIFLVSYTTSLQVAVLRKSNAESLCRFTASRVSQWKGATHHHHLCFLLKYKR